MERKTTDGEIRNKERTKLKLINAVGEIIRTEGYTKLGVNHIANTADVSKKLIYKYFGTVENLIELYLRGKGYTISINNDLDDLIQQHGHNHGKELIPVLLENLFEELVDLPEVQKILLWEISESSKLMRKMSADREKNASELLSFINPSFEKTETEIQPVYALLLGGIYYLVLHSGGAGGSFCEIDIKKTEDKKRVVKAMKDIIHWTYKSAHCELMEEELQPVLRS